jgi:hypothetical protein
MIAPVGSYSPDDDDYIAKASSTNVLRPQYLHREG